MSIVQWTSPAEHLVSQYRTAYKYSQRADQWTPLPPLNSVGHRHSSVSGSESG